MQCVRANHCFITRNNFWHTISVVLHNKSICFPRNTSQETMASQSTNDGTQCWPVGAIAAETKARTMVSISISWGFYANEWINELSFRHVCMVLAKLRRWIFGGKVVVAFDPRKISYSWRMYMTSRFRFDADSVDKRKMHKVCASAKLAEPWQLQICDETRSWFTTI